jgi:molybdenum cofactor cytidylyltransferase
MRLIRAIRYSTPDSMAFVGAGGKSTAIFSAARELTTSNNGIAPIRNVLVTTSTHFGTRQAKEADLVCCIQSSQDIHKLQVKIPIGVMLIYGKQSNDRLGGLEPGLLEEMHQLTEENNLPLLIEADGAHERPLKAPAEHEPAIPEFVKVVVVVAGLSGLGNPLNGEWVHRPEIFAEITGMQPRETITVEAVEKELLNNRGGLKNIPLGARQVALLNQADTPELQSQAKTIAVKILPAYSSCIISSLKRDAARFSIRGDRTVEEEIKIHATIERIGGIILAGGSSSRFGEPKQLLMWKGEPLIRHVVRSAVQAGLSPVVVVVGSSADLVLAAIKDLPLRIVNNFRWAEGMSSSIKAGLKTLTGEVGGAVFLQADQPQIPPRLIKSLVEAHQSSLSPIIAPQIDGQRGNPVLFDTDTFTNLLAMEGDVGGRALFNHYPVEWVIWHDPRMRLDIDSPEDYQLFLRMYPDGDVLA